MKSISLISFFFASLTLSAQPKTNSVEKNDPEAEKYLKLLKTKLERLAAYKMNFNTEIIDIDQKKESLKGSYLGSGDKFELDMPDAKTINDGKTQWTINKKDKEINIANYSKPKKSKSETPIDIVKNYATLFKYRVKEPLAQNKVMLELIPLNKNSSFFKVDIQIDVKKNQIISAKLYDRGGHRIIFSFSDMVEYNKIPSGSFSLNISNYKDFEILDLR